MTTSQPKIIGEVTHFFGGINVAVIKCVAPLKVGDTVHFKGSTTDTTEVIASMQIDHKSVSSVKKGDEVAIKLSEKVRVGDQMFAE